MFGALVLVATFLTVIIGPSSAILILPQLEWWAVKHPFSATDGFTYPKGSCDSVWPNRINRSSIPGAFIPDSINQLDSRIPRYCSYAFMFELSRWAQDYLSQDAPPNLMATSDANMLRYLISDNKTLGYSVSSTGMSQLTHDFGTIWLYGQRHNLPFATSGQPQLTLYSPDDKKPVMMPLVQVQCDMPYDISEKESITINFPSDKLIISPGETPFSQNITQAVNATLFNNVGSPKVNFIDLSVEGGRPTLGALVGMSFNDPQFLFGSSFDGWLVRGLIPCTIGSHWIPTTLTRQPETDNVVYVDNPNPMDIVDSKNLMENARNIDIDLEYVEGVNIKVPFGHARGLPINAPVEYTVLEYELAYLAFNTTNSTMPMYDGNLGKDWQVIISNLLSLQLSNALVRLNHNMPMFVYCQDYTDHPFDYAETSYAMDIADLNNKLSIEVMSNNTLITAEQVLNLNHRLSNLMPKNSLITLPDHIRKHPDLYTPVQWRMSCRGYGWDFKRVTKCFAAIIIILHSLLVFGHIIIFAYGRRWRCDCWSSLVDILALAVQSPPTPNLRGTSTGINNTSTYNDTVLIRESVEPDDDCGEQSAVLIITDRPYNHRHHSRKLKRDKKYL